MDKIMTMRMFPRKVPEDVVRFIYETATNRKQYVGWLEVIDGEVMLRIFAYQTYAKKGTQYTEVIRRITGEDKFIYQNMYFCNMSGWHAVYEQKDHKRWVYGYEDIYFPEEDFNIWTEESRDWFRGAVRILNIEVLTDTRFKYCGYSGDCDLMQYLARYDENPKVEFFGKLRIRPDKSLVKRAAKDKQFCLFLRDNAKDISLFGAQATMYAYDHRIPVDEARRILYRRNQIGREICSLIPELTRTKIDRQKLMDYLENMKNKGRETALVGIYNDYLKALKYLKYDLTDTKNIYPRDFWRMHDLRIDEYEAAKAKEDKQKRAQLYSNFKSAGEKVKGIEWSKDDFVFIVPLDASSLKREGAILHHCVGKMGYDLKVAEGRSVIVFLRRSDEPDKPYFTIEYGIKQKKVLQCYGLCNSAPGNDVREVVKEWEERTKKILARESKWA